MDKITIERIETAHPKLRQDLRCIYKDMCDSLGTKKARWRFSHVFRTLAEQAKLYAQGRTAPGPKVTNAPAGSSYHNYGLAVDIVQLIDKDGNGTFESASWDTGKDYDNDKTADWLEVVQIFNRYGWQWGIFNSQGKRYDLPHFQKTFGYSISQLKALPKDAKGYPILN